MKQLTKTQRQLLEYNRLVGFNLIKEKYHKLITLLETKKFESINSEFTNYANKIKTQFGTLKIFFKSSNMLTASFGSILSKSST